MVLLTGARTFQHGAEELIQPGSRAPGVRAPGRPTSFQDSGKFISAQEAESNRFWLLVDDRGHFRGQGLINDAEVGLSRVGSV